MKPAMIAAVLAAAALLSACSKSSNVTTQSAAASSPATGGTVVVKAGTKVDGKLQSEISSKTSHDGDTFTLAEQDTMFTKNPALHGAVIEGHLEGVTPAGLGKKPAMTIVFDDIRLPDGTTAPIAVRIDNMGTFDAKSHHWRTIGMVIGAGVAGHMAAGKHHGGMLGAAGGYMLSQQMKTDIDVKPGSIIQVRFLKDATASVSGSASPN